MSQSEALHPTLNHVKFDTKRLQVRAFNLEPPSSTSHLTYIVSILSDAVVQALPPYFQGINDENAAQQWLDTLQKESDLFTISLTHENNAQAKSQPLIGFLFLTKTEPCHIGYLLAENYWGKGLASELLMGFKTALDEQSYSGTLMAGVDASNNASSHLLLKVGFEKKETDPHTGVSFFQLTF